MARAVDTTQQLAQLQAENRRLQTENEKLRRDKPSGRPSFSKRLLAKIASLLLLSLAVALLVAGNLLFWTGHTIVNTDRYIQAVSPVIEDPTVQKALADYTTVQLFKTVDINSLVADALPPRADFLAPSVAGGLKNYTNSTLDKILASPKFQATWNEAQARAHDRFITTIKTYGGDGSIDVHELYQRLSGNLQGTKLAFLANKKLPDKVGSIQVVSGSGISTMHRIITHIDMWRTLTVILFLLFMVGGVWLSRHRRRTVFRFGLSAAAGMLVTLISVRIAREVIAGKAMPQYADAVRQTAKIVLHPLVIQTTTILLLFLVVAIIAWITGPGRGASLVRARTYDLLSGKLHTAIFGSHEPAIAIWLGRYKRQIEWLGVIVVAIVALIVRLTPGVLTSCIVALLIYIAIIETLAATPAHVTTTEAA